MIRKATPDDLNDIVRMGLDFFNASGFSVITDADTLSIIETVDGMMKNDTAVVLVADVNGELVGMAAAVSYPLYFNRIHLTGQELFWWVDLQYRRQGHGSALLDGLVSWARSLRLQSLMLVSLPELDGERVSAMYQGAGFRPFELNHIRRLDYGH
jgi:GNAT superfamily N-acetyltransferase